MDNPTEVEALAVGRKAKRYERKRQFMITRNTCNDPRSAFYDELHRFYELDCGAPHVRDVAEVSRRLKELSDRGLPELSRTCVWDLVNGRRRNLPNAEVLASLILCLQRRAYEIGVLAEDPGPATLPEWHRRLRVAREQVAILQDDPPPTPPRPSKGNTSSDGLDAAPPSKEALAPPSPASDMMPPLGDDLTSRFVSGPDDERPLSLSEQELLAECVTHGLEMRAAEPASGQDSAFHLAVLMGGRGRGRDAMVWLEQAAADGHPQALELLAINADHLDRLDAAACALDIADRAAVRGDDIADVYYKCAAECGLPGPAVTLANRAMIREDIPKAMYWLEVAAVNGDVRAEIRLSELRRGTSQNTGQVPLKPSVARPARLRTILSAAALAVMTTAMHKSGSTLLN